MRIAGRLIRRILIAFLPLAVIVGSVIGIVSGCDTSLHKFSEIDWSLEEGLDETASSYGTVVPQEHSATSEGSAFSNEEGSDVLTTITIGGTEITIPAYQGAISVPIHEDEPFFTEAECSVVRHFEDYSPLDALGRCGTAYANICLETMPTEERGDISQVYPSGWKQNLFGEEWAYNRCHLIAFMLAGENDNEKNLITGTRQFNVDGMLPYESLVSQTVHNYNADVLYRVTPVFKDNELVARGVLMEAYCIEYPEECTFCVFVYNVSDLFTIDYATGQTYQ